MEQDAKAVQKPWRTDSSLKWYLQKSSVDRTLCRVSVFDSSTLLRWTGIISSRPLPPPRFLTYNRLCPSYCPDYSFYSVRVSFNLGFGCRQGSKRVISCTDRTLATSRIDNDGPYS